MAPPAVLFEPHRMSPDLNRTTLASLIVAAITTPAAFATEADIDREVELLREEIARYRAGRRGSEIDDDRRLMIEQSIDLMLADLSPANDGITGSTTSDTAGWDGSPGWRTADGDFSLFFSAQVQVRFVMNRRRGDEPLPDNPSGTVQGIENRRTRLVFEGTVVDPSWAYRIQGAYSRSGGNFFLEDTWVRKSLGNGVAVQVGQFKPPFLREDLVSSRRLLAVERTAVCDFFRQAWAQGIQASFISDEIRAAGWFGDGIGPKGFGDVRFNSINTPWQNTSTRYSATGRVDWKLAGEWWQFESFNSPRGSPTGIMLGVAGAVQEANQNLGAADGTRVTALTADATFCFSGVSAFVSGVFTEVSPQGGPRTMPWGVTAQAGAYVLDPLELFLRYEHMYFDDPVGNDPETARFNGFTVGGNWFFAPEVKLTLDWTYNFASLAGGAFASNGVGFRNDAPGETGQWALRAQLQLVF